MTVDRKFLLAIDAEAETDPLREKVEEKLRQLEKDDIIEKVDGPTPWVSQPIFLPKSSDPTDIRMCVDMNSAYKAILRTRMHITPTIEEIVSDLKAVVKFSKLDLNKVIISYYWTKTRGTSLLLLHILDCGLTNA